MSLILTVRIAPGLLAKAEAQANRLGLDRAGYVRNLIERDVASSSTKTRPRFASQDLVGAFRLGGKSATNRRVREVLHERSLTRREANR